MARNILKPSFKVSCFGFGKDNGELRNEFLSINVAYETILSIATIMGGEKSPDMQFDTRDADILLIKKNGTSDKIITFVDKLYNNSLCDEINIVLYAPQADQSLVEASVEYKFLTILIEDISIKAMVSMIQSVHSSMGVVNKLQKEVMQRSSAIGYIKAGEFDVKSLKEAYNLSTMLSLSSPDPKTLAVGLFELISNAIEHGNLDIGYKMKTKLLKADQYYEEVEARLKSLKYKDKSVTVLYRRDDEKITFTIWDQGHGFDPKPYMEFDPKRMFDLHGRGIAMSMASSFDNIKYDKCGTRVTCVLSLMDIGKNH